MDKIKESRMINDLVGWYQTRSILREKKDLSIPFNEDDAREIENLIKDNSREIIELLSGERFLELLREEIKRDEDKFSVAFAEPYDEDLINIILFDLKRKGLISEEEFENLKEFYSKKGVSIDFEW